VPPQWATKAMNRATADNQSAQSEEEGLEPTKEWVKDLIDEIVAEEFASPDLELHWLDEDEGDPETVLEGRLKVGALTLNEMRDALGLDPFDNAAADRPMVLTATGFVPIEANAGGEGTKDQTAPVVKAFDQSQPRVPAGNPDGGQWTTGGGGSQSSSDSAKPAGLNGGDSSSSGRQYAALTATQTDAPGIEHIEEPSPRYAMTVVDPNSIAVTGNPAIDRTTIKLMTILAGVMNSLGSLSATGLSPQKYGMIIHQNFANAVRAAVLPGIAYDDVETTFPEGESYGDPDSIRTDVVLRNDGGNIIAIYDVKTGERGLTPTRVAQLLAKTGALSGTSVIEIRNERSILKIRSAQFIP
jgi:hypothetical protein